MSYTGSFGDGGGSGGGGGSYSYSPPPSPPSYSYSPPSYSGARDEPLTFGGFEDRRATPSPPPSPGFIYKNDHEDAAVTLGGFEDRREEAIGGEVIVLQNTRKSSSSSSGISINVNVGGSKNKHHKHRPHATSSASTEVECKGRDCWVCLGIFLLIIGVVILLSIGSALDPKPDQPISKPPRVPTFPTKKPLVQRTNFYAGSYEAVESSFSPASISRNVSSLAFKISQVEDRISIEPHAKVADVYTFKSKPKGKPDYIKFYSFQAGKPFPLTEFDDSLQSKVTYSATIEIDNKSKVWVEIRDRKPKKVKIERMFTETGMATYYTVDKVIYVKKFKRRS